jgi:hypothetical protein
MTSRLISHLIGLASLSHPFVVLAQESDQAPRNEIINNAWSDPSECNEGNAKLVSFTTLSTDFEEFRGDCVAVEGYWFGRALFASAGDASSRQSAFSERLNGERIGLYAQWETVGEPPVEPMRRRFVGFVGECETQWPSAMMVMGYCHYTGGPILLVSEVFPA